MAKRIRTGLPATPTARTGRKDLGLLWSVPVPVAGLPEGGRHFDLKPDAATRAAIAKAAGVVDLPRLEVSCDLVPTAGNGVRISGLLSATVEQTCVVSLEPVVTEIREPIELILIPADAATVGGRADLDPEEEVVPEPLIDGIVDLGTLAVEFLVLGIDPYPRKPGVAFEQPSSGEEAIAHPFAALAALKPNNGKK